MQEQKNLTDFWDPTRTGISAMQVIQGQQHLALQQQQVEQSTRNQEIDNARQAFLTAAKENPLAAVAAWNNYAGPTGLPKMDNPNALLANPQPYLDMAQHDPGTPQHQEASRIIAGMGESQSTASRKEAELQMLLQGGKQLAGAVGAGTSPAAGMAVLHSSSGQAEAYKALLAQQERAGLNMQLTGLVPVNSETQMGLDRLRPHTEALADIQQKHQQWAATYGPAEAKRKADELIKSNPALARYTQQAQASAPVLEQQLQELQTKTKQVGDNLTLMATGARPQGPQDSLQVMQHQLKASSFHERLLRAQLDLAKDPTNLAHHASVARAALEMNSHVQGLINQAIGPEQVKAELADATNMGRQRYAALPPGQQNSQSAAKIAQQVFTETGKRISTTDVLEGNKLANRPLVEVTNKIDTMVPASVEAQKEFMKSTRTTYDQLKSAPALLNNIAKAKELIPQAKGFMGPGGETLLEAAKFLNNRVGTKISTAGIKSAEELRSRIFFNIMDNLKKMDAQPSQMQQQIMQESLGKLGTDPNALVGVLDAYEDTIRDKVEAHNTEVEGAVDVKFPYNPRIKLPARARQAGADAPPVPQGGGWSIKPLP